MKLDIGSGPETIFCYTCCTEICKEGQNWDNAKINVLANLGGEQLILYN